jgi:hypothetical protein
MTPETQGLSVENALLRVALWRTARALKDFHDSPHRKIDDNGREMLEVTVPASLHAKAGEALAKAQEMLKGSGQGQQM